MDVSAWRRTPRSGLPKGLATPRIKALAVKPNMDTSAGEATYRKRPADASLGGGLDKVEPGRQGMLQPTASGPGPTSGNEGAVSGLHGHVPPPATPKGLKGRPATHPPELFPSRIGLDVDLTPYIFTGFKKSGLGLGTLSTSSLPAY